MVSVAAAVSLAGTAAAAPQLAGLGSKAATAVGTTATAQGQDKYKDKAEKVKEKQKKRVTQVQREAAASRALQEGALNPLMAMEPAAMAAPGDAPRYFSHPNYANSPLPEIGTAPGADITVGNPLQDRAYATDESTNVLVMLPQDLPDGFLTGFKVRNQADQGSSSAPSAGKNLHAYVLRPTGTAGEYTVLFDSGLLTMPALADPAVGEDVTFGVSNLAVQAGDRIAFFGNGVPLDMGTGTDAVFYPTPAGPAQDSTVTLGAAPYPTLDQARTYSFAATLVGPEEVTVSGGLRKFVDPLPTLQVAQPDADSYPGSDYYEIALVEYEQKLHRDLANPTKLRGYVQLTGAGAPGAVDLGNGYFAAAEPTYLGAAIVAQKDRPVRIRFRNLLPKGEAGELFLPVDSTVMGSGMTADGHKAMEQDPAGQDPQNPMCSEPAKAMMVSGGHCYPENRATLHLHGGVTPWISDGTPHQWITPAGETTPYPEGVSVENVPDMPGAGASDDGSTTFYYTNAQSARLMFYHDHAWGITRLNVYAGEAAPYVIEDETEKDLVDRGVLPAAADTIPLVVQDKTFVPNDAQLAEQDETWDKARWGGEGSLWLPHVYSPAQNPGDSSGVNAFGRWAYGPWFWPPTNNVDHGPIDNPYADPACDPDLTWCEPAKMPGTPYNSMGMESFMDTPVVNGKAYPTVELDPKSYRFRILNAANDRFFNLSLYQAIDAEGTVCDKANPNPVAESTGVACTEVALDPNEVAAALDDTTVFPTPLNSTKGPEWISIGTEGGFLPAPVKVPAQPITWVNDPTVFNAGNVDQHSLLVAPAERHDVVVDLSQYAGQTLIVYNDAPAAFPARDPRYDYYTGNADLRDSGGASSTLPGYGPNTRTVMQIKVKDVAPAAAFDFAALSHEFESTRTGGGGVFEKSQKPIMVGQGAYNSAYGTSFQNNGPKAGLVQIFDTSLSFQTLLGDELTMSLKPKMIQDEMGEAFEHEYGRMSGYLGVETPNSQAGNQNMILSPYTAPPTEILDGVERDEMTMPDGSPLPPGVDATPIASADDGTQIWKFTHNGVDTHPIHFHLYDVQLLNRVGWDGIVRKAEPTEIGWKDTVRISPLEDTIVALRPIIPPVPDEWNGLPNSIRLLDPSHEEGAVLADTTAQETAGLPIFAFNPDGEPIDVVNHYVNFGWEYVLHCHILSHEEMDMMHAQVVGVKPSAPSNVSFTTSGSGRNRVNLVSWTDRSKNETSFVIERRPAGSTGGWTKVGTAVSEDLGTLAYDKATSVKGKQIGVDRSFQDPVGNDSTVYEYDVYAVNTVGDTWDYSNPAFNEIPPGGGFPTLTLDSRGGATAVIADPSNLAGSAVAKNKKTATVNLTWTDNSANETGFLVQRADNAAFSLGVVNATLGAGASTFSQNVTPGRTYYYRVLAFDDAHQSGWSNTATVTTP